MSKRSISFKDACSRYVHRYTMDHVPEWAKARAHNGKFYAPQYASDAEWYACTEFNGEGEIADSKHCYSSRQTWPLGHWLDTQFDPSSATAKKAAS